MSAPAGLRTGIHHFEWFCHEHLQHSIGHFEGLPVDLEKWQRDIFTEALTVQRDNAYLWSSVVIVLPRKNGKTTLLGAYALYRLLYEGGSPEILLAASSNDQAGRLFNACAGFVRRSAWLSSQLHVRQRIGEIERVDGEGIIHRMSSSAERLHGYNPSLVICDEVAQWTKPSLRDAWAALTTGGGARKQAQVFTISTAGKAHHRTGHILGDLVDGNERVGEIERHGPLTISRNYAGRTLVYNYSALTVNRADVELIRQANPASWLTTDYLSRQAANPELTDADFLQLHGCVWAESDSQFMPPSRWAGLYRQKDNELLPEDWIALGFDGSREVDATGLVAVRLHDRLIVPLAMWERPSGSAGEGWQVPTEEVDAAIDAAHKTYKVWHGLYDPNYWQSDVARWALKHGKKRVRAWPTSAHGKMSAALKRFRTDAQIVEPDGSTRMGHAGKEAEHGKALHRHIVNAQVVEFGTDQIKIEKPGKKPEDRIDLGMSAILGYEAACLAIEAGALKQRRTKGKVGILK